MDPGIDRLPINRVPGRLVIWALIALYGWALSAALSLFADAFLTLGGFCGLACPMLILAAIVTSLSGKSPTGPEGPAGSPRPR